VTGVEVMVYCAFFFALCNEYDVVSDVSFAGVKYRRGIDYQFYHT
jgi:hypothetical protein